MKTKQNNPTRIYREVSVDDFLRDPILNEKRIKAYRDIAKDYNVQESTIRDVFMLGINFTIANMQTIELPSEAEIERYSEEAMNSFIGRHNHPDYERGINVGASFILNHIKGGGKNV